LWWEVDFALCDMTKTRDLQHENN